MIARHENGGEPDTWSKIAAPLPTGCISWRQDGRPVSRDGKHVARFVAYIEAGTVRERLDLVVPGEWDLTLELLPSTAALGDGESNEAPCAFKARLSILGVIREDVGVGKDYKQASTDAFKRAAVRFGIGHELYEMDLLWVELDGDGKYAKPVEDPAKVYARKHGGGSYGTEGKEVVGAQNKAAQEGRQAAASAPADDIGPCPKCGGRVWDNRATKRNPRAPDAKCRDRSCDGVIWPPKPGANDIDDPRDQLGAAYSDEIPF